MIYKVCVHFRYISAGEQEKDFETYTVEAESEEKAKEMALALHCYKMGITFKTEIV